MPYDALPWRCVRTPRPPNRSDADHQRPLPIDDAHRGWSGRARRHRGMKLGTAAQHQPAHTHHPWSRSLSELPAIRRLTVRRASSMRSNPTLMLPSAR